MLLDDDDFLLEVTAGQLKQLGLVRIKLMNSGPAALQHLRELRAQARQIDVMICDIDMPGMDGIEFIRHLVAERYGGGIIVLTGADDRMRTAIRTLLVAHDLTPVAILKKPTTTSILRAALMSLATDYERSLHGRNEGEAPYRLSSDDLKTGLVNGCLELHYQPKVSRNPQALASAEALLRWRDPVHGLVPPVAVIAVAEASGTIDLLTRSVFRSAAQQLGEWSRDGHDLSLSVNLSMDDLTQLDLPEVLTDIAIAAGTRPSQFILEITESRFMQNVAACLDVVTRLRLKGFGLSIDDFGTGYASLEKLQQLPFTELKVDRMFVRNAHEDPVAHAILESSVQLAHSLGMQVVAEGAETAKDWQCVVEAGCDTIQGFVIARPLNAAAFIEWKKNWDPSKFNLQQMLEFT
jgi:EAL domain-containing protein (putative c-di-GMP-specific phosphodiesterase class I)/CheY-like chemotaxis protein